MIRMINFLLIALMLVGAGVVYDFKYEAEKATAKVAKINRKIDAERDAIATLKAEWSLLNQPRRLQELTEKHHAYLELDPLDPTQIGTIDDIPFKPAVPAAVTPTTPDRPAPAGIGAPSAGTVQAGLAPKPATKGSIKLAQPGKPVEHPVTIGKFLDRLPSGQARPSAPTTTGTIPKAAASGAPMMLAPLPLPPRSVQPKPSEPSKVIR